MEFSADQAGTVLDFNCFKIMFLFCFAHGYPKGPEVDWELSLVPSGTVSIHVITFPSLALSPQLNYILQLYVL